MAKTKAARRKHDDGKSSSRENTDSPEIIDLEQESSFVVDRDADADDVQEVAIVTVEKSITPNSASTTFRRLSWLDSVTASLMTEKDAPEEIGSPVAKNESRRFKVTCFNCNGEHNLNQCSEPKNMRRIRENQQAFREKTQNRPDGRYHGSAEGSLDFKAGRLSEALQRALDVGPNDIPEYIYRMRKMGFVKGYPPAYLKKAIVREHTGDMLTFHTGDETAEESGSGQQQQSPTLNPDKIIYYFGFNKLHRNLRDRERGFRIPPFDEFVQMHEEKLKATWREEQKEKKKAKKRRGSSEDGSSSKKAKKTSETDDITLPKPPTPPPMECSSAGDTAASPAPSSSRSQSLGTPVLSRRSDDAPKPDLAAFGVGIVPFEVEAPTERTGFFKKMMNKIKRALS